MKRRQFVKAILAGSALLCAFPYDRSKMEY